MDTPLSRQARAERTRKDKHASASKSPHLRRKQLVRSRAILKDKRRMMKAARGEEEQEDEEAEDAREEDAREKDAREEDVWETVAPHDLDVRDAEQRAAVGSTIYHRLVSGFLWLRQRIAFGH